MDRAVAACDREFRFQDLALLENIVGEQNAPRSQEPDHLRQKADILALRRVHKYEIKSSLQFRQDPGRVSLKKCHALRRECGKILPCPGRSLFVPLNGDDLARSRRISVHDQRRIAYRRSDLQDPGGTEHFQKTLNKAPGVGPNDRYTILQSLSLQLPQFGGFFRVQRFRKHADPLPDLSLRGKFVQIICHNSMIRVRITPLRPLLRFPQSLPQRAAPRFLPADLHPRELPRQQSARRGLLPPAVRTRRAPCRRSRA